MLATSAADEFLPACLAIYELEHPVQIIAFSGIGCSALDRHALELDATLGPNDRSSE